MGQRRVAGWSVRISLIWTIIIGMIACSQITTGLYNGYQGTGRDAKHYALVMKFYRQGDYHQSLEESLTFISRYPKSALYDKALFYAALNNLHLVNSDADYSKAIDYFKRLMEECPNSPLRAESNTWIAVLTRLTLKLNEIDVLETKLEGKKVQLALIEEEKAETMRQLREEMELRIKHLQRKKNREIAKLKKELELLKKVDVQLEQRKRGLRKQEKGSDDKRENPGGR